MNPRDLAGVNLTKPDAELSELANTWNSLYPPLIVHPASHFLVCP